MKCPRIRLRWLVPLSILLLPPLSWALLLTVAPTDWARQRVVAKLSLASGRSVRVATLRLGVFGGIYLTGLEIGAPGASDDPWLKVAEAHINVSPLQMFCGKVEPTETDVRGVVLRIRRRADGSLELADLIRGSDASTPAADSESCPLSRFALRIRDARVDVIDTPTRTRLAFTDVEGRATWVGRRATIQEMRGALSGGTFEVTAQLDRSSSSPSFEGHIRATDIALNEGMGVLGYLVPFLSDRSDHPDGTLGINLYLRGEGTTRDELRRSIVGHGAVSLDPIELEGSRLLDELAPFLELPPQWRVGSAKSDFEIKQGRISSDDLTINITRVPIVLSGWTDFDGRVNYRVRGDGLADRLPGKARELLADLSIEAPQLNSLKVEGAIDSPTITVDGIPLNPATCRGEAANAPAPSPGDDRERLKDLGRRLRDRLIR
jgi:AsmA protein